MNRKTFKYSIQTAIPDSEDPTVRTLHCISIASVTCLNLHLVLFMKAVL